MMTETYYVAQVTEQDAAEAGTNVYGCLPRMPLIDTGLWLLKSEVLYRDLNGDIAEEDRWHPECGVFVTEDDAIRRLNDLRIAETIKSVAEIIRPESKSFRRRGE